MQSSIVPRYASGYQLKRADIDRRRTTRLYTIRGGRPARSMMNVLVAEKNFDWKVFSFRACLGRRSVGLGFAILAQADPLGINPSFFDQILHRRHAARVA